MPGPRNITAGDLRTLWRERREVALFDAREEAAYALAHPFFAVSLPLSRVEASAYSLVPRRSAPVVVYDYGEGLAERVAARLEQLGYSDVRLLEGGLAGYAAEGELFRDVNVASKAFGELVEAIRHTPSLSAPEVKQLIDANADMVVLDVRRFEEYRTMSLPSAISVPNGEIALRVRELALSPETLVVVNCAGRTRSIIGTQTLVNAGIPNRVAALRNGTIGWTLEGYSLEHGQTKRFGDAAQDRTEAQASATAWAAKAGVRVIDQAMFKAWFTQDERTVYRFDVRTPEEYEAGHPTEFVSAPGGQLVQATDEWAAVRGARIVLFDDDGVRARMTGSWLAQMGWETAVIGPDVAPADETGIPPPLRPPPPAGETITPEALAALGTQAAVLDLAPSPVYQKGHIPGAWFILRSRFREELNNVRPQGELVLTSPDGQLACYAAAELERIARRPVKVLAGGTAGWIQGGYALETACRWASEPNDVYKRPYEGTDNSPEAMRAYIEWELQLVAQLANDGICNFHVIR